MLYDETVANNYLDTLPFSRKKLPNLAKHRLTDLAAHYNISTEGAHRALNDCIINQKCFELMEKEIDQNISEKTCPKCGSDDLTKIDRMNGYLSYSRVHGDTRLNDAKMAEIAERKSM